MDLDDGALATFLRLGYVVGEDTVFRSIRMVPPGGRVHWSGGEVNVEGGYHFPKPQNLSRATAIVGYGELVRQAVRRRASKEVKFGLPLSGGRDSRHILLELNRLGILPEVCFTNHDFPPYRTENIKIAGLLTSRLGIPHRLLGNKGSETKAEIQKNEINNFRALENAWCINLYPEVARHTQFVYEGSAGDVSAGMYLRKEHIDLFGQNRLEELADKLLERVNWKASEGSLKRVMSDASARRFSREAAIENLFNELRKHLSAPSPLVSFYLWNRERGVGALQPFGTARIAGVHAITPYMDHDVLNYLASIPESMLLEKTFHTETIHRMHPEFSDIPYAGDKKTSLIENSWHYRRHLLEIAAYLAVNGNNTLIKKRATLKRLLSIALSQGGNVRHRATWIAPYTVLYLTQLERLCALE